MSVYPRSNCDIIYYFLQLEIVMKSQSMVVLESTESVDLNSAITVADSGNIY